MSVTRLLLMAAAVWSTASATGIPPSTSLDTWRVVVAWLLVVVLLLAVTFGQGMPTARLNMGILPPHLRTDALLVIVASITALVAVLPNASLTWMPFVAVVLAGSCGRSWRAAALSVPPAVALGYASWQINHSGSALFINLIAVLAVFGWIWLRRAESEARDLAEAQQLVIAHERAKAATAQRQQQVAAQLHDVLAHTLSGLIVSLQTATLEARQEQASPQLQHRLSAATDLAKEGLGGARQAVESLHGATQAPVSDPAEDLGRWWSETTDRLRSTVDLHITTRGEPAAVPAQWTALAQSVLRESLTNSLRHAAGRPVRVTFSPNGVQVLSEGEAARFPTSRHPSGGYGLAGLQERIQGAGGFFTAGIDADGWLVTMTWPHSSGGMP
ncbi:sensor histidine kinase [Leekyejoonella antrihumi]|uniref:histidine kinase n=1 Tax=Leekyejoonella antrihumi TaxID=1660198 RepID=A0A563E6S3_9MICO|nr:histidine kinase [Leekyejoonella antrihumi]TWP37911.1 hypothetical protein FGL98_04145 [Leekyejoonella antrihumi]